MKREKVFKIIYHSFIIGISCLFILLHGSIEKMNVNSSWNFLNYYYEDVLYFTIAKDLELNKDYEPLTFSKNVSKEDRDTIEKVFYQYLNHFNTVFSHDASFGYSITDHDTNNSENSTKKNNNVLSKGTLSIVDGYVKTSSGEQFDTNFDEFSILSVLSYFEVNDIDIDEEDVTIKLPENITLEYSIPNTVSKESFLYETIQSSYDDRYIFVFISMILAVSLILVLYLFIGKYEWEMSMPIFNIFKNWYIEPAFLIFSTAISVLCMLAVEGYSFTMSGALNDYIPSWVSYIGCTVIWIMLFYSIGCAIFIIKTIFKKGFKVYLKENTILGYLLRFFDKGFNVDISRRRLLYIVSGVLVNFLVICIVSTMDELAVVVSAFYSIVVFIWILKKYDTVQTQYYSLLKQADHLVDGEFDHVMDEELPIFSEMEDKLTQIHNGFEEAVKEKTESQNMKNELISNVSHDLKTPLTCIKNYVSLLQLETDEQKKQEYLQALNQYTNRLNDLIMDLFDISKVNSGTITLDKQDMNIYSLVEQVIIENSDELDNKNLQCIYDFNDKECILSLDGNKTYRVFNNLFVNISKYALENSRVYVDVQETENSISFIIKNISKDAMNFTPEQIVERFVRGDKSRHETGSGLGLAIVKSFVEAQGGTFEIFIEGDLFKTTVTFYK